jgi:Mrp family chromosome partitioning ATPase
MATHRKQSPDLEQFGQLRARIEAMFPEPAIIVVTSAARNDGKSATSLGLATALADADSRVLYVDANITAPTLDRSYLVPSTYAAFEDFSRLARPVCSQRYSALSFADARLEKAMSLEKAKFFVTGMRDLYDFIIVDTAPLVKSDMAVLFASISDGTLVTLKAGRFPSSADKELVEALSRVGAKTLGAVTVSARFTKYFFEARQELAQIALPSKRIKRVGTHESGLQLEAGDITSPSAAS